MQISLSHQEKSRLGSRHKKSRDKRECDRIKAILLSDEGWSPFLISQALRKHQTSIIRHLNDYEEKRIKEAHQLMVAPQVILMKIKMNY